ncbi:MAG: nuclear transport factor 2 family protein [Rhodobacteraceae bacterium]|uniref:nuclear transport factor 2 family protein n=1 Tax=Marivita sp. TaxID=2003365 RepID=UPI003B51CC69|nr:nuclear transport factor 2 family protein [Paracoccaceae bacterium]
MKDSTTDEEAHAIQAVAMDYAEGWYTGNAERMARALHPAFIKRTLVQDDAGRWTTDRSRSRDGMIALTKDGEGTRFEGDRVYETHILDVFRDIATVRCLSAEYVDYLHLARFGADGWKIVNVLWQLREGDFELGE